MRSSGGIDRRCPALPCNGTWFRGTDSADGKLGECPSRAEPLVSSIPRSSGGDWYASGTARRMMLRGFVSSWSARCGGSSTASIRPRTRRWKSAARDDHDDRGRATKTLAYPDFDLLEPSDLGTFDVVICEQVLEHVRDPWRAMSTLAGLCRPGGTVIVSTPFILRVHPAPQDFWRFTTDGIVELFSRAGLGTIETGAWGNRWCIRRNFGRWVGFRPWHHWLSAWTLRNDIANPQVVWGFARRPVDPPRRG